MLKSPTKILYQSGTLYPDDIQVAKPVLPQIGRAHV